MEREFKRSVSTKMRGTRLDHYLVLSGIGISRNQVVNLIGAGAVLVNEKKTKPSYRVKAGDQVRAQFLSDGDDLKITPEPMDLKIVYEDEEVIVIDKPQGLVVHPARGHSSGTLVNGLLYHCKNLPRPANSKIRPGVIHRLDKDTTGLLVFAKTDTSLTDLGHQIEARKINREYLALVWGNLALKRGEISAPIGRSTLDRKRMAVTPFASKQAKTTFEVLERFQIITYLRLKLHTGRTHQIRVHLAHYNHPVVGDPEYGGRSKGLVSGRAELPIYQEVLRSIDRQALHAAKLGFVHPRTKQYLEFVSPLPLDMDRLLGFLRNSVHKKTGANDRRPPEPKPFNWRKEWQKMC